VIDNVGGRKNSPSPSGCDLKAPLCVAYKDVGQGREQDAEALLVTYLEQLKGAPCALIDAFSAHNRGGDERSTSPGPLAKNSGLVY
jgi:hypothetical protein